MRRALTLALMMTLLIPLYSCGGKDPDQRILEMRTELLPAENILMDVDMLADSDGNIFEFSMQYSGSSSAGTVTVTAPASVCGLTARVSVDDATVTYDGLELTVGRLAEGITPATVIPVLMDEWKLGYLENCRTELADGVKLFAADSHISDEITETTWFSESMTPVRSEIYDSGYMVVAVDFVNFTMR